ncbi:MAG: FAD-binding oxidoreductase [Planctomycetes bacterium]|nr:FAD-binding oxidoreductase [Planctomycetota bacterium]
MSEHDFFLTRRNLLLGSAALGGAAMLGSPATVFAADAAPAAVSGGSPLDDLGRMLSGELITPSDSSYDDVRKVWNGMIDKRPLAIARCSGVADVIQVIEYARNKNLPVSVRGGGHNVAGKALRDGAITIDLRPMHGIRVDPDRKTGRAQGGTLWRAFDRETVAFNLVTTGGTVSTTGIGGLTLGGGIGWLMGKYGLACDNLVSADVVTADGRFLTASAEENDDLFWALRGGGGNFGVVTSFEFGLHDLEPIIGGMALYPQAMSGDLLRFFRDFTASAPDSVTSMFALVAGPPGTPLEGQNAGMIAVCHSGPLDEGKQLLQPIKDFGPPVIDSIGPMAYTSLQTMFDAGSGPGRRNYWKSNFMQELSDGAIDTIVDHSDALAGENTMILVEHMGGAVRRVGSHATAFSNRDAKYNASVLAGWNDPRDDQKNIAWTRELSDALKAFATGGGYVNYMAADESAARVHASYEANYQRLVAIKRKYDPTNFFSGNQNIAP